MTVKQVTTREVGLAYLAEHHRAGVLVSPPPPPPAAARCAGEYGRDQAWGSLSNNLLLGELSPVLTRLCRAGVSTFPGWSPHHLLPPPQHHHPGDQACSM